MRIVIIDVSHLFYKYAFGMAAGLSCQVEVDGVLKTVDTTLPAYTIKQIHRWSDGGFNPTVVCFDSRGSNASRRAYFINSGLLAKPDTGGVVVYKEGRGVQDQRFYDGINMTLRLLLSGGVTCLQASKYEADDLIFAAVQKAKKEFPNIPIDVITGDADLIPLVDEQVSVFLSSKKTTWAESSEIEKRHYVQLRPYNMQEYVEGLTAFKNLSVPYNTVLLTKLLRGDSSDKIPGYPKFTPTKYRSLISQMINDGVNLSEVCRYDAPTQTLIYRDNSEPIPENLIDFVPNENKAIKYGEPVCLTNLCEILSNYLEGKMIEHVRTVYNGINLNCAFTDLGEQFNRRPASITAPVKTYRGYELQTAIAPLMIKLPVI